MVVREVFNYATYHAPHAVKDLVGFGMPMDQTPPMLWPTVPTMGFGPLADRHAVLGRDALPCRPCSAHGGHACPLGHWTCMRDLTASAVRAAVAPMVAPMVSGVVRMSVSEY